MEVGDCISLADIQVYYISIYLNTAIKKHPNMNYSGMHCMSILPTELLLWLVKCKHYQKTTSTITKNCYDSKPDRTRIQYGSVKIYLKPIV